MYPPLPVQTHVLEVREVGHAVSDLLTTINNKYSAELSKAFRSRFGLGVSDCRVIGFLAGRRHATGAAIGEALQIDKALVSRSVARLRAKGVVTTGHSNGHGGALTLTRRGEKLHGQIAATAQEYQDALLQGFDRHERQILVKLLRKLEGNLPLVASLAASGRDTTTMPDTQTSGAQGKPSSTA